MVTYFQFSISCINIWVYVASISSELSSADDSSIEAEIDSSSSNLLLFSNYSPYSNCAKVIISPVCSWEDTAYVIYDTAGRVSSAYEYGRDVYAKALYFFVEYNVV